MTDILHTTDLAAHFLAALQAQNLSGLSRRPTLAVICGSSDAGPQAYIRRIASLGEDAGVRLVTIEANGQTETEFCETIRCLGDDPEIDGILVLFPLPDGIRRNAVVDVMPPEKDVDCLHPLNLGKIMTGAPNFQPCTATGALMAAHYLVSDLRGKNCVIIGSSAVVGRPLSMRLLDLGATVSVVHIDTQDIKEHCKTADVLFSAVGKAGLVDASWIKNGATLIDIGISYSIEKGRVVGDMDLEAIMDKASAITAVPDGVGPLTTCTLLANTSQSAFNRAGHSFTFPALPQRT